MTEMVPRQELHIKQGRVEERTALEVVEVVEQKAGVEALEATETSR